MNAVYDAVVVGARCAGASTAMLLAQRGLSVLVVDKSGYGSDTSSTHALTRAGVLQLSRWGILDEVRAAGTPRVTSVEYRYGDDDVVIPIRPDGDVDGLYAPRRTVLDRLLVDAAARSGAAIEHHTRLRSLRRNEQGRVIGVDVDGPTGPATIGARLVIGADGARSTVARLVEAPVLTMAPTSTTTMYGFVPGLRADAYRNLLLPGIAVGVIPTNDGLANVWASAPMKRFAAQARPNPAAFFDTVLTEADRQLAAHVRSNRPDQLRSFPGMRGFVRRPWGPGWALVGDALYFKDPISAHGMTDALIGAELLARAVADIVDGRAEADALDDYAARRTELTAPMMSPIAHLSSFEWTLESARAAHIEISRVMRDEWDYLSALSEPTAVAC